MIGFVLALLLPGYVLCTADQSSTVPGEEDESLTEKASEATWKFNFRHNTSTTIPLSAGFGKVWKFSNDAALNMSLSAEWMAYRQFAPQEEQFTLKFQITLLFPKLEG